MLMDSDPGGKLGGALRRRRRRPGISSERLPALEGLHWVQGLISWCDGSDILESALNPEGTNVEGAVSRLVGLSKGK